jgi:hypothetical protein
MTVTVRTEQSCILPRPRIVIGFGHGPRHTTDRRHRSARCASDETTPPDWPRHREDERVIARIAGRRRSALVAYVTDASATRTELAAVTIAATLLQCDCLWRVADRSIRLPQRSLAIRRPSCEALSGGAGTVTAADVIQNAAATTASPAAAHATTWFTAMIPERTATPGYSRYSGKPVGNLLRGVRLGSPRSLDSPPQRKLRA